MALSSQTSTLPALASESLDLLGVAATDVLLYVIGQHADDPCTESVVEFLGTSNADTRIRLLKQFVTTQWSEVYRKAFFTAALYCLYPALARDTPHPVHPSILAAFRLRGISASSHKQNTSPAYKRTITQLLEATAGVTHPVIADTFMSIIVDAFSRTVPALTEAVAAASGGGNIDMASLLYSQLCMLTSCDADGLTSVCSAVLALMRSPLVSLFTNAHYTGREGLLTTVFAVAVMALPLTSTPVAHLEHLFSSAPMHMPDSAVFLSSASAPPLFPALRALLLLVSELVAHVHEHKSANSASSLFSAALRVAAASSLAVLQLGADVVAKDSVLQAAYIIVHCWLMDATDTLPQLLALFCLPSDAARASPLLLDSATRSSAYYSPLVRITEAALDAEALLPSLPESSMLAIVRTVVAVAPAEDLIAPQDASTTVIDTLLVGTLARMLTDALASVSSTDSTKAHIWAPLFGCEVFLKRLTRLLPAAHTTLSMLVEQGRLPIDRVGDAATQLSVGVGAVLEELLPLLTWQLQHGVKTLAGNVAAILRMWLSARTQQECLEVAGPSFSALALAGTLRDFVLQWRNHSTSVLRTRMLEPALAVERVSGGVRFGPLSRAGLEVAIVLLPFLSAAEFLDVRPTLQDDLLTLFAASQAGASPLPSLGARLFTLLAKETRPSDKASTLSTWRNAVVARLASHLQRSEAASTGLTASNGAVALVLTDVDAGLLPPLLAATAAAITEGDAASLLAWLGCVRAGRTAGLLSSAALATQLAAVPYTAVELLLHTNVPVRQLAWEALCGPAAIADPPSLLEMAAVQTAVAHFPSTPSLASSNVLACLSRFLSRTAVSALALVRHEDAKNKPAIKEKKGKNTNISAELTAVDPVPLLQCLRRICIFAMTELIAPGVPMDTLLLGFSFLAQLLDVQFLQPALTASAAVVDLHQLPLASPFAAAIYDYALHISAPALLTALLAATGARFEALADKVLTLLASPAFRPFLASLLHPDHAAGDPLLALLPPAKDAACAPAEVFARSLFVYAASLTRDAPMQDAAVAAAYVQLAFLLTVVELNTHIPTDALAPFAPEGVILAPIPLRMSAHMECLPADVPELPPALSFVWSCATLVLAHMAAIPQALHPAPGTASPMHALSSAFRGLFVSLSVLRVVVARAPWHLWLDEANEASLTSSVHDIACALSSLCMQLVFELARMLLKLHTQMDVSLDTLTVGGADTGKGRPASLFGSLQWLTANTEAAIALSPTSALQVDCRGHLYFTSQATDETTTADARVLAAVAWLSLREICLLFKHWVRSPRMLMSVEETEDDKHLRNELLAPSADVMTPQRFTEAFLTSLSAPTTASSGLFSRSDVKRVGSLLLTLLLASKHMGVHELAQDALQSLCSVLSSPTAPQYARDQTQAWLRQTLDYIASSARAEDKSWIRRGAGLSFCMLALLRGGRAGTTAGTALKGCTQVRGATANTKAVSVAAGGLVADALVQGCVSDLLRVFVEAQRLQRGEGEPTSVALPHAERGCEWKPMVHVLNLMRAICRDRALYAALPPGTAANTLEAALSGFSSDNWNLRNSSLLCFAAVASRMLALTQPEHASLEDPLAPPLAVVLPSASLIAECEYGFTDTAPISSTFAAASPDAFTFFPSVSFSSSPSSSATSSPLSVTAFFARHPQLPSLFVSLMHHAMCLANPALTATLALHTQQPVAKEAALDTIRATRNIDGSDLSGGTLVPLLMLLSSLTRSPKAELDALANGSAGPVLHDLTCLVRAAAAHHTHHVRLMAAKALLALTVPQSALETASSLLRVAKHAVENASPARNACHGALLAAYLQLQQVSPAQLLGDALVQPALQYALGPLIEQLAILVSDITAVAIAIHTPGSAGALPLRAATLDVCEVALVLLRNTICGAARADVSPTLRASLSELYESLRNTLYSCCLQAMYLDPVVHIASRRDSLCVASVTSASFGLTALLVSATKRLAALHDNESVSVTLAVPLLIADVPVGSRVCVQPLALAAWLVRHDDPAVAHTAIDTFAALTEAATAPALAQHLLEALDAPRVTSFLELNGQYVSAPEPITVGALLRKHLPSHAKPETFPVAAPAHGISAGQVRLLTVVARANLAADIAATNTEEQLVQLSRPTHCTASTLTCLPTAATFAMVLNFDSAQLQDLCEKRAFAGSCAQAVNVHANARQNHTSLQWAALQLQRALLAYTGETPHRVPAPDADCTHAPDTCPKRPRLATAPVSVAGAALEAWIAGCGALFLGKVWLLVLQPHHQHLRHTAAHALFSSGLLHAAVLPSSPLAQSLSRPALALAIKLAFDSNESVRCSCLVATELVASHAKHPRPLLPLARMCLSALSSTSPMGRSALSTAAFPAPVHAHALAALYQLATRVATTDAQDAYNAFPVLNTLADALVVSRTTALFDTAVAATDAVAEDATETDSVYCADAGRRPFDTQALAVTEYAATLSLAEDDAAKLLPWAHNVINEVVGALSTQQPLPALCHVATTLRAPKSVSMTPYIIARGADVPVLTESWAPEWSRVSDNAVATLSLLIDAINITRATGSYNDIAQQFCLISDHLSNIATTSPSVVQKWVLKVLLILRSG